MKLYRVIVPVKSIEKATEFYSRILNMEGTRVSSGRHYFNCGGTILACYDPVADGDDLEPKPNPDHIYISVADIEKIFNLIKDLDASLIQDSIKNQPWGEKTFYIKDPFGNPICFVDEKTVFMG